MKAVKIILLIILGLAVVFVAVPLFLPSSYSVGRSIIINSPAKTVFNEISDFHTWDEWSKWHHLEKEIEFEYSGSPMTIGHKMSWDGDTSGAGSMEIIELSPDKSINYKVDFFKPFKSEANAALTFDENNGMTKVSWTMSGKFNYLMRYMGLIIGNMIGADLDSNLINVKKICESMPKAHVTISEMDYPGAKYYGIKEKAMLKTDDVSAMFAKAYGELSEFAHKNNIKAIGPPFAISKNYSNDSWEFIACFAVSDNSKKTTGRIITGENPSSRVVRGVNMGPYELIAPFYEAMEKYIADKNLTKNGDSWELYISDPMNVPKDSIITEIYYPVK